MLKQLLLLFLNPAILSPILALTNGVSKASSQGLQKSASKSVQQGKTTFNHTTKYVLRGEQITLCSFEKMTDANMEYADLKVYFNEEWVGDFDYSRSEGKFVYATKRVAVQYRNQVFLNNKTNRVDIKNAMVQNEGEYRCEIDHGASEYHTPFKLEIVVLPTITVLPATILVVGGKKKTFVAQCHAEKARPKAEVEWDYSSFGQKPKLLEETQLFNHDPDLPTQTTTNQLKFKLENHHNSKVVHCKLKSNQAWSMVKHPQGYKTSASHTLNVQFRPEQPEIEVIGDNKVACHANANPAASYSWSIRNSLEEKALKKDDGSDYTIPAASIQPNMSIICTAQNAKGSSEQIEDILPLFTKFEAQQSTGSWDMKIVIVALAIIIIIVLFAGIYFMCARDSQGKGSHYEDDMEKEKFQSEIGTAEKAFSPTVTQSHSYQVHPPQSDADLVENDFPEKYEIPENNGDHFIQQDEHMKNEDQVFHETFDNTLNTTNEMDMPNGQSAAQIVPDGDQIPTGNYSSSRHPDEIHHSPLTSPDSQQPLRQALSASGQNIGNPVSPSVTAESFNYYVAGKDGRQPEDAEYYDDPRERYVSTN